jgi:hypothetical protein
MQFFRNQIGVSGFQYQAGLHKHKPAGGASKSVAFLPGIFKIAEQLFFRPSCGHTR